ncbi:MAG: hypothetical protein Q7T03_04930 [Deltaproteobacteria bacterium]|nr:hypothetical protein [Deltaproteobacteria bacterium]
MGKYLFNFILIAVAFYFVGENPAVAMILIGMAAFILFFFRSRDAIIAYSIYFVFEGTILLHAPEASLVLMKYLGDILILAIFFAVFAKLAIRRYQFEALKENKMHIPILLFLVAATFSAIINQSPAFVFFITLRQILRYVVLFYSIILTAEAEWTETDLKNLAQVILALILIQAGIGYLQLLFGINSGFSTFLVTGNTVNLEGIPIIGGQAEYLKGHALFGTLLNPNTYGLFLATGFCLLLGLELVAVKPMKRFYLYLLLFIAPVLLKSYSRQSLYATLLGTMIIALIRKQFKILVLAFLIIAGFAIYLSQLSEKTVWGTGQETLAQRIVSPFDTRYIKKFRMSDRLWVINDILPQMMTGSHALLGYGPGSLGSPFGFFQKYFDAYKELKIPPKLWYHLHTGIADVGFVAVIGQYGIIGFIFFYGIFVTLFWTLLVKIYPGIKDPFFKGITLGFMGYIIGFLLSNIGYNNFVVRQISYYFWILAGIICAYWSIQSRQRENSPS